MNTDIPDLIAGALGVSRGTAYDMMREALAEQPAQPSKPLTGILSIARHHPDGSVVTVSFKTANQARAFEQYALEAAHAKGDA